MRKRERLEHFRSCVAGLKKRVFILMTQVDPDAVASAVWMEHILKNVRAGLTITIAYCGAISHPQNQLIADQLHPRLRPLARFRNLSDASIVMVDSSSAFDTRIPARFRPLHPDIVVDHHRSDLQATNGQFVWIEKVGATTTLLVELGRDLGINRRPRDPLLTHGLLAIGIQTDTRGLVGASRRDQMAFGFAMERSNPRTFTKLSHYPMPSSFYDQLRHAIEQMKVKRRTLVTSAGTLGAHEGDHLALIANSLMMREGIRLAVVYGIVGNSIRISARSTSRRLDLNKLLKQWFGEKNAGAKVVPGGISEGGAYIELDRKTWFHGRHPAEAVDSIFDALKRRIFDDTKEA